MGERSTAASRKKRQANRSRNQAQRNQEQSENGTVAMENEVEITDDTMAADAVNPADASQPGEPLKPVQPVNQANGTAVRSPVTQAAPAVMSAGPAGVVPAVYAAPNLTPIIASHGVHSPVGHHPAVVPSVYHDVVSFLRILVVNSWLIVLMAALGAGVAYLYSNFLPNEYESVGKVIVVPNVGEGSREQADIINIMRVNLVGNYVQIFYSEDLTQKPAEEILAQTYDASLIENAEVSYIPIANSTVIEVQVRSTSAEFAQAMADTLIEQAIKNSPERYASVFPMEILDTATLPNDRVSPNTRVMLLMGGGGGFVVGIVLAFILDAFVKYRRSHRQAAEARQTAAAGLTGVSG